MRNIRERDTQAERNKEKGRKRETDTEKESETKRETDKQRGRRSEILKYRIRHKYKMKFTGR
jgi:hypothetical protein